MRSLEALIPSQEPIPGVLREKRAAYPLLAVREAVANALIHQDLSVSGAGPTVELFSDRIEITNPPFTYLKILVFQSIFPTNL